MIWILSATTVMKYALKPIILSFRYKWTLLASVLNALVIGVLWGVSITTVYPFVEIVFEGESAGSWLVREIKTAQEDAARIAKDTADLKAKRDRAADPDEAARLRAQLAQCESRLAAQRRHAELLRAVHTRFAGFLPRTPFGTLVILFVLLIAATIIKGICLVLNVVLVCRVADRTAMDLRRQFYRAALEMDQQTVDRLGTTQLMTLISHNINMVSAGLKRLYGHSVREPLKMAACLVVAALISWRLLLLSLFFAPLGAIAIHYLARRMKRAALHEMGGMATVFHTLIETLSGLKTVRVFNRERSERRRFKKNARTLYRLSMRIAFYDSLIRPVTELISVLSLAVAILGGAYLVLNQETHLLGVRISNRPLSSSALLMFFAMLAGISDPARKLSDIYNVLVRGAVAAGRLYRTFEAPPTVVAHPPAQAVPLHCQSIRFDSVSFAYRPKRFVLIDVNLQIPFGQTVALVGENGCGKTTLVNLIPRFYDPVQGSIFLDNVDLVHVNPKKLRGQIAIVSQDPFLFQGTVWENIQYGRWNATPQEIQRAAKLAQVDAFVQRLAHGYQTAVGDQGKSLSGGQRQRIALARAILADPRILILDEATSQIDPDAEQEVHQGLRGFLKDRTTLLITHRRSTLALADRVILMDHGRITADMAAADFLNQAAGADGSTRDAA